MKDIFNRLFCSKEEKPENVQIAASTENALLTAAEEAAVAMALHLYYQDSEDESYVITIEERQSEWNSKIYGLNNLL